MKVKAWARDLKQSALPLGDMPDKQEELKFSSERKTVKRTSKAVPVARPLPGFER